jgi:hypothetical protein
MQTEEFFLEPNFPGEYQALGLVQGVWFPKRVRQQRAGCCVIGDVVKLNLR